MPLHTQSCKDERQGEEGINTKRWGDGSIKYTNIRLSNKKFTYNDKEIFVTAEYKAKEKIQNPVFGFSVKNGGGTTLFGTNTRLLNKEIEDIEKGSTGKITWKVPNVLNDGDYFVDVAVSNSDETTQYDWWEDSLSFTVYREQHTTYVIEPPIEVEVTAT